MLHFIFTLCVQVQLPKSFISVKVIYLSHSAVSSSGPVFIKLHLFQETSQHDVQELNRILFSALESSLVGTSGSNLIHRLYHGTLVNQIVCKECSNVSERQVCMMTMHDAVFLAYLAKHI